jgi:hypothetical protein
MQTLFEVGFIAAFILPPAAVAAGICAALGSLLLHWPAHARNAHDLQAHAALQHPVGR